MAIDKHKDYNQNFWELGSILGTTLGLPAMLVGGTLASNYGMLVAIKSIIVGNLLLWAIGLGILAMTEERNSAVGNIKEYLGKPAAIINSIIIIGAFILWYSIQIDGPTQIFVHLLNGIIPTNNEIRIRLGAGLGFFCSLLSLGGIRLIKWVCVIGFPLILVYQIYAIFTLGIPKNILTGELSFSAISIVLLSWLPGAINLSTFYRHAKSKVDAFLGLSIMTIAHIIFQSFTALILVNEPVQIILKENTQSVFYIIFTSIFVLWGFICINLSNIYFASAGWDTIVPEKFHSAKKYAIIGMLGTLTYTFLQKAFYMGHLERAASNSIACLAITLLVSFLLKIIVKHRLRPSERFINSLCWFFGWVSSIYTQVIFPMEPTQSLIVGVRSTFILYLIILFLEESVWALKQTIFNAKNQKS